MAYYRLYFLSADGRIRDAVELDCPDDGTALGAAEALRASRKHRHAMELWQQSRKVKAFAPL
jgi:hypothetical protein